VIITAIVAFSFVHKISRPNSLNKILFSSKKESTDEEESSDSIIFNDFDYVIGSSPEPNSQEPPPTWKNSLEERLRAEREKELHRNTKLVQNWKRGDWSVRGFSLDPSDALSEAAVENQYSDGGQGNIPPVAPASIYVSQVVADVNSAGERIFVGRSNGSLLWVRLGTEYTTNFRSKLSGKFASSRDASLQDGDEDSPSSFSAQIGSELVREPNEIQIPSPDGEQGPPPPVDNTSPFCILAQFSPSAAEEGTPISTILSVPDEDCIFTASEGSGQIQHWHISEDEIGSDSPALKTPVPLSDGIHNGAVVALKTVWYRESPLLLSVGSDGTLALWDISSTDLVYHCQISPDDVGETENKITGDLSQRLVHCADVNESQIFIGTASGYVLGYDVADLMNSASSGASSCPLAQGKFQAHEGGVTAIACGGPGSLGRPQSGGDASDDDKKTTSSVLLTGGEDCIVKQW
jgi:WD40 repeat protein